MIRDKFPNFFYKRNWYKKTFYQNSFFWKQRKYLILFFKLLTDFKLFFKFILKPKNTINIFYQKYYSYFFDMNCISSILCTKDKKLPISIKEWNIIFYHIVGPFLCMKRDDITKINKVKSNLNYKQIRDFYKFSKKKYLSEDFYFSTLYFNLVSNNYTKSKNIMSYHNINNDDDVNYYYTNLYSKDILFIRRVVGSKNINLIQKKFYKKW